jgi:tetratricopeptide (TPR) repeat protein
VAQADLQPVRAGGVACPDPERLAAYVDGVLSKAHRREVQTHLVNCHDCRDLVAETANFLCQSNHRGQTAWFRRNQFSAVWLGSLAAAATLALAIVVTRREAFFRPAADHAALSELIGVIAKAPTRSVEGRLSGGLRYAPPPATNRGGANQDIPADLLLAASKLALAEQTRTTPDGQAGAALAFLIVGDYDRAITALEFAVQHVPTNPRFQSDLAVAYLARARLHDREDDWSRALAAAERAITLAPQMEEAYFNRALALDGLHRDVSAVDAWVSFGRVTESAQWQAEAADRQRAAGTRAKPKG